MRSSHRLPWRLRLALAAVVLFLMAAARAWAGGTENTATGTGALPATTTGSDNTADGFDALHANKGASNNTAVGANALGANTNGNHDTATGSGALSANTTGHENTADGCLALHANTTGYYNTAAGHFALGRNTTGEGNTASGFQAMSAITASSFNTAFGFNALGAITAGDDNTAVGLSALGNLRGGEDNIALGQSAGYNLTGGSDNIYIGSVGESGDNNTIRVGGVGQTQTFVAGIATPGADPQAGVPVYISGNGQMFVANSSRRFKDDIRDMADDSAGVLALRPVRYRYKPGTPAGGGVQYGLIAEEVEKVNPDLVVHETDGTPLSVRYERVNAMLLNEFLKAHATIEAQAAELAALRAKCDSALGRLDALSARLPAEGSAPPPAAAAR